MRNLLRALLFTAFYLLVCACQPAHAQPVALELPAYLKPLPRYLFVGEPPGTVEAPAFFMQLVRVYLQDNPRLVVGLALNPVEQEAINRFLTDAKASDEVAEKRLLRERGWRGYIGRVDGRYSQAMLTLLHDLRATAQQQRNGYPKVVAFATGTDEHAARILQQALARNVGARLISQSAQAAAMNRPLTSRPRPKSMPDFFPEAKTASLEVVARGGTAWACGKTCGAIPLTPSVPLPPCAQDCFVPLPPDTGFAAQYVLMRTTASPPAVQSVKK